MNELVQKRGICLIL